MTTTKTVFYADCEQFDDHSTGYYATADEAVGAFWAESLFAPAEKARVVVVVYEVPIDSDVLARAHYLAGTGSPSPALGVEATA